MREYGQVPATFWTGRGARELRRLGRDAQVVALYLQTCPQANLIGLYYLPIPSLCHEIGISEEGAWKALRSLIKIGFCDYDDEADVVWVIEMAANDLGELRPRDKRVPGVRKQLEIVPRNKHLGPFLEKYAVALHLEDLTAKGGSSEAPSEALRSQKQEQEQNQDQEQDQEQEQLIESSDDDSMSPESGNSADSRPAAGGKRKNVPHQKIIELYHQKLPNNPTVTDVTETLRNQLRARWNHPLKNRDGKPIPMDRLDQWEKLFRFIREQCPFLTGDKPGTRGPFRPNLQWLTKRENFAKIVAREYVDED